MPDFGGGLLAWPCCRSGYQVRGLACGAAVGADSDGVEADAIESVRLCGCLPGDLGS